MCLEKRTNERKKFKDWAGLTARKDWTRLIPIHISWIRRYSQTYDSVS